MLIEINDRNRLSIYQNVTDTVDSLLRGYAPQPEVRQRMPGGSVTVVQEATPALVSKRGALDHEYELGGREGDFEGSEERDQLKLIFPYGVSRNKIERAIANLRIGASIARKWDEADVVLTLKALERKESEKLRSIAAENVPIYSIKMNALKDIFNLPSLDSEEIALREAGEAIYKVLLENQTVELSPQTSYVRRLQHQLAEQHRVMSRSTGLEPNRRVLLYRGPEAAFGAAALA